MYYKSVNVKKIKKNIIKKHLWYLVIFSFTSVKLNVSLRTSYKIESLKNNHFHIDSSTSVELSCKLIKKRELQIFLKLPHLHSHRITATAMVFDDLLACAHDAANCNK